MDNFVTNPGTGGATFASDDVGGVQYPRAKQVWGADGFANDTSTAMPLPVQTAATNFIFSALGQNTSVTQLAAAATFTGTVESIQSQQTISVLLVSDRNGTLTLKQFIDSGGTQVTNTWVINVLAGVPFSRAYTANGNYFQLIFTNTSGATTTTLSINTAYGTLPAVTDAGFGPVDLSAVNGVALSLGQTTMAASLPVTIASNQATIPVGGGSASGTTATGNPSRSGGVFNTAQPTVTTGQVVDLQTTARGEQLVMLSSGAVAGTIKAASTAAATADTALVVSMAGANSATKIGDGTNNTAIKAASTAAAATDSALVVAISPNNGVAITGTGGIAATKAASTAAVATDIATVVSLSPNSPITAPTLTKGTQGATGLMTQDIKDSGRSTRTLTMDSYAVVGTAETLNTLGYSTENATATTGTSYNVTAGKRFRVQSVTFSLHTIAGNTTSVGVVVRIRAAAGAAATITSPVQMIVNIPGTGAANGSPGTFTVPIPDGWEFAPSSGIAVTTTCPGYVVTTAAPKVDITINGFEY